MKPVKNFKKQKAANPQKSQQLKNPKRKRTEVEPNENEDGDSGLDENFDSDNGSADEEDINKHQKKSGSK